MSLIRIVRLINLKVESVNLIIDRVIIDFFNGGPPCMSLVSQGHHIILPPTSNNDRLSTMEEDGSLKESGFMWGVPKNRRSKEMRRKRRFNTGLFGHNFIVKPVLTCNGCGNYYEPGRLCATCYGKISEVTESMQEAMINSQKLGPIEAEVKHMFKGEKVDPEDEFCNGKRIVEVEIERPSWFSKNLMQKSNATLSDDTAVEKPSLIK